jgi:hypothetical protein
LAANSFAIDQWQHLHRLNASSLQESAKTEVDDDCRPRWDTPLSKPKVDLESTISASKKSASALTEPAESAPFRSSLFPASILHAEADLRSKRAFKDEVLRTDAAGPCSLSLVRCSELAHTTLGKESPVIIRMKDTAKGESPQDVDSLLAVLRDSLGELDSIRKEIYKVSLVGSKIAAGIFNQGIKEQRRLVCNSPAAKAVKSTLEVCKPSLTHLFGDDDTKLDKALEAAKFSRYQSSPYCPKAPFHFCSSDSQEGSDKKKKKPYKKPYKPSYKPRSSGKAQGPASKKGEGQQKK